MNKTILYSYDNGNTHVTLYSDGSKERTYEGIAKPEFPESLDVKITNFCTPTIDSPLCNFCHEKSTMEGRHGDLEKLVEVLSVLPAGTEIAIGGGNPLSHPFLISFLKNLKSKNFVPNITVNQKHLKQYSKLINYLLSNDLIYGLGISYSNNNSLDEVKEFLNKTDNVVFHLIMGINTIDDIENLYSISSKLNKDCKVLVLGYKNYGFGSKYLLANSEIEYNKYNWYTKLARFFKRDRMVIAFDNLAINQLNLKRYFTDEAWDNFYMGDEATHSMYVDGVDQMFAPYSTSDNRSSFNDISLINFFKNCGR